MYASGEAPQRRDAHRLLANALAGDRDADRRAWHTATATVGPDEDVAQSLEQAAGLARQRGGPVGSARAFERAAGLSPDPPIDFADSARLPATGSSQASLRGRRRSSTTRRPSDPTMRNTLGSSTCRRRLPSYSGDTERAFALLTAEADRAAQDDPGRAGVLLARAVLPVLVDGDVARAAATAHQAQALAEQADWVAAAQVNALVMYTFVLAGDGQQVAPLLGQLVDLLPECEGLLKVRLPSCALAAGLIWTEQHGLARQLLGSIVRAARETSAPAMLPYPLVLTCDLYLRTGEWAAASAAGHEAVTLARQLRQPGDLLPSLVCLATLEAAQGRDEECRDHAREALEIAGERGFRSMTTIAHHALGLLSLGQGRPSGRDLAPGTRREAHHGGRPRGARRRPVGARPRRGIHPVRPRRRRGADLGEVHRASSPQSAIRRGARVGGPMSRAARHDR